MSNKPQQKTGQITASKQKGFDNLVPFKTGFDIRRKNAGRKTKEHTFSDTAREMLASNHIEVTWTTEATGKKGSGRRLLLLKQRNHSIIILLRY